MRTIAHVSDLHFGTETASLVDALRKDLKALAPDLLVVSGDLTQRARTWQFRAARSFLDTLPFPRLVVPGNHDIPLDNFWLRAFRPYARYHRYIDRTREPLWKDDEVWVLGLDTSRPSLWKDGRISAGQVARIRSAFQDAPASVARVLVTHHPFLPPRASPTPALVGGATEAMRAMEEVGAHLLLSGHLHLGYHADVRRHYVKVQRELIAAQAGTAVSARTRGEPNAYNVVRIDGHDIEVEVRESSGGPFLPRELEAFHIKE